MIYKFYLREGYDLRLIAEDEAERWPIPIHGERWSLLVDGEEWLCEIEELGHPQIGLNGRTLVSQDIFVRRLAGSI